MTHVTFDTADYKAQLNEKAKQLQVRLAPFTTQPIDVYPSPPEHYRMRAEFRVWHDDEDLYYIMFDPETRERIRMDSFPAGSQLMNNLMPALITAIKDQPVLRRKLFQVDFLTTTSQQAIVSLLYHRQLDEEWTTAATELNEALQGFGQINLIGRARKQKIVLGNEHVIEKLTINDREYLFEQVENSFTQPNAMINQAMVEWALAATRESEGDLLELYCGNGNFSLPLAQNFDKVLATEISKVSVASARTNIELNKINNVTMLRMSAEDFSAVMDGSLDSRRANEANITDFNCRTVLVDPPRAGLDDATVELVRNYDTIIYVSCNPETLLLNLAALQTTHYVERAALFDQFPYTEHMEAGVVLRRIE